MKGMTGWPVSLAHAARAPQNATASTAATAKLAANSRPATSSNSRKTKVILGG